MEKPELRFLGDFEVRRDGKTLRLPPSKKTRALLAFLCLNPRRFRREYLCELLWDMPDDPRGSLRWSLSKLRPLVDDKDRRRIVADRTYVEFDASDVAIDVADLNALTGRGFESLPTGELEQAAMQYRGNFLEGLDLPNFHDYHSWCVAERENVLTAQVGIHRELVERLAAEPERALPHARSLVGLSPYDEVARASLIRLLVGLRYPEEAEQQYRLGMRMLAEAGVESSGALYAARRGPADKTATKPVSQEETIPVDEARPRTGGAGGLVGRDGELRLLCDSLRGVQQSGARLLVVSGDPGMGKSRLLSAFHAWTKESGASILAASAFEPEQIRPFALWVDGLRKRADEEDIRLFEDARAEDRGRLFAALSGMVRKHTAQGPVVILFDDFHWSDESSAAALHYVARMERDSPLLAVISVRGGELRDNAHALQAIQGMRTEGLVGEIELQPLPEQAIREIIGDRLEGETAAAIAAECNGNPLLAIELARAQSEGRGSASLDEMVRQRLARFDLDGIEVLRWAAVLSPRIQLETLVRLAGVSLQQVEDALETAERQAIVRSTPNGLRFAHNLVARAIYNDISPLRRQIMHRRVADLLEQNTALDLSHASDLAHHASLCGDPAMAARALVSAGRLCLRFYANEEALKLARKGLQRAERLSDADRVRLRIELNDIILSAAPLEDWEKAARAFAAMADEALDHGALEHARLGYHMAAYVRWAHDQWAGAWEQTLQSERAVRGASDEPQVIGMAETAKCLVMIERDLAQAEAMLMEASSMARRLHFSYHAIPAGKGMLRLYENRLDEARELFQEARTQCKVAGDRICEFQAIEHLVMIDLERGDVDEARRNCEALMDIGSRMREGSEEPYSRVLAGLCTYAQTEDDGPLEQALEDLRQADAKHRLAYTLNRAALVDLERGRLETARERAREALGYAELLDRASESLLARLTLINANDGAGHGEAVDSLLHGQVAQWARLRAEGFRDERVS